jgi:hypothetical protein
MRFIDVVLACVVIGLIVGYVQMGHPGAARAGGAPEAQSTVNERITWLRTPALMRRTSSIQ